MRPIPHFALQACLGSHFLNQQTVTYIQTATVRLWQRFITDNEDIINEVSLQRDALCLLKDRREPG